MKKKQIEPEKPKEEVGVKPQYIAFKNEAKAYLESVTDIPMDDVLKRELNTILPGLFTKHFPNRIRERRDLSGVFELTFEGDKCGLKFDKEFMESLKYDGMQG